MVYIINETKDLYLFDLYLIMVIGLLVIDIYRDVERCRKRPGEHGRIRRREVRDKAREVSRPVGI